MVKFVACAAVASAIVFGAATVADMEFADMENHWAKNDVAELCKKGIVSGMEDGLFHPDDFVTTEQFVAMTVRSIAGDMEPTNGGWSSGYMDYAAAKGLTEEYDVLNKANPIERRSAARIIHAALISVIGEADEPDWSAAEVLEDLYDCHTCVGNIAQMYVKGIMVGREGGIFDTMGSLTRAEAAAIIARVNDKDKRVPPKKSDSEKTNEITPEQAEEILKNYKFAILIDVREESEFEEGHIKGSVNIPFGKITENPEIIGENKDTSVILYCKSGYRSAIAAKTLTDAGYERVFTIPGTDEFEYELIK